MSKTDMHDRLLAAVVALIQAKDDHMETPVEWRRLRRAVATARKVMPEDPKPEEPLAEALREGLSPHAVAAIVAYLQPVRTMDPEVVRQVRWFADLLTTVVGGDEELDRLCEEVGL